MSQLKAHTSQSTNHAALLLGSNQGDRHALLRRAEVLIATRIGPVEAASSLHETEPWGSFSDKPNPFLNQALLVATHLEAIDVLHAALAIEATLGRHRPNTPSPMLYRSRPIDIDLIFFDDLVVDTYELILPHPRMHLRRFVLESLAEIMPNHRHPLLGSTVAELLRALPE